MKKKDIQDLRKKDIEDLEKLVDKKRQELLKAKVEMKAGEEKNLKIAKNLRRDLSQTLTVLREKEIIGETRKQKKETKKSQQDQKK